MKDKLPSSYFFILMISTFCGGRFGDQIPEGARFLVPFQNVPRAHPTPYKMVTKS